MTVELLFTSGLGPQPGGAVSLVFGGAGLPPPEPPPPEPPAGNLRAAFGAAWRGASAVPPSGLAAPWRASQLLGGSAVAPWGSAAPLRPAGTGLGWAFTARAGAATRLPWSATQQLAPVAARLPWRGAVPLQREVDLGWRDAKRTRTDVLAPWRGGKYMPRFVAAPWRRALAAEVHARARMSDGAATRTWARASWQAGLPVQSLGGPWSPPWLLPPPPPGCYVADPGDAVALLFRDAMTGLAALLFACRRPALAVVPIRRVYMVTNVTSLVRVSDGTNIPVLGFSLSLDVDSWAWGFSASIAPDALSLVEPDVDGTPVELAAWVNGTQFRVFTEAISRDRTFGQVSMRLQGRGKTAVLDAPISPVTTFSAASALTSQQLLDQALPAGWTADWGLEAWLVPGGVWSHQGTPISAAVAIAQAGGGYVQPHASADSISVLPLYPTAPWDWGGVSPDVELPAAYAQREGIEWLELPRYNRAYVSGASVGVLGRVTRLGSAGDVLAPMVTDPLITTAAAARQRGLPVLAKTGRLAMVTLRLPVAEGTGVIRPGTFVRYVDGSTTRLGLARGVTVEVLGHQVWQTIRLETFA